MHALLLYSSPAAQRCGTIYILTKGAENFPPREDHASPPMASRWPSRLTIAAFSSAALGGHFASNTASNSSSVRPLVSTPKKYQQSAARQSKSEEGSGLRRTVDTVQADKDDVVSPRDGLQGDRGYERVVEVGDVGHDDVLLGETSAMCWVWINVPRPCPWPACRWRAPRRSTSRSEGCRRKNTRIQRGRSGMSPEHFHFNSSPSRHRRWTERYW